MLLYYLYQLLLILSIFGIMMIAFPNRTLHLHHWLIGLIFTTFLSSPDLLTAALHGFCNAIMVEGGA